MQTIEDALPAEITTKVAATARRRSNRLAAASGLTFVALAVGQNIVRAITAPANDARSTAIVAHFVDHRGAELALAATVVAGAFALALFVGHLWSQLSRDTGRSWAYTGIIGAMGIFAIFPILVACEVALLVVTDRPAAGVETVETLWALHNALFTVNMAALGVATLGLTLAALSSGLLPRPFRIIGPLGAALLALGALVGPQIAAGDAKPAFGLSGIGYLTWLSVVATISLRLLRTTDEDIA